MSENLNDESLVERVATAIRSAHVAQALERVKKHDFPLERIEKAFEIAKSEADRSTSILLFALAEDLMLGCFKANMNGKVSGGWEAVTGGNGVLATAANRLSLLELLYWIKPRTGADLRLMKSIRNRFAHHAEVHSFEDQKVAGWVTSMTSHEKPLHSVAEPKRETPLSLRELYLIRSVATLVNLATDLGVGPIATQERVHPDELVGGDFDAQPENMKAAVRMQAGLMLSVYMLPTTTPPPDEVEAGAN